MNAPDRPSPRRPTNLRLEAGLVERRAGSGSTCRAPPRPGSAGGAEEAGRRWREENARASCRSTPRSRSRHAAREYRTSEWLASTCTGPSGGLVVDVQSDLLDPFSTRVVIPLVALGRRRRRRDA